MWRNVGKKCGYVNNRCYRTAYVSLYVSNIQCTTLDHIKPAISNLKVLATVDNLSAAKNTWDTFAKTPQIRTFPLHPLCSVDLKGPSHPESLQALSTLLGGGRGRAVTKTV